MNVLALNGSPRMQSSSTFHILQPLLEGMENAGATTDLIHVRQLDLHPCIGCYACWVRTPGTCIYDDGMDEAIARYNRADLVIFGTPLYHFSMSGTLKHFIDRLLPHHEPWLIPHPRVPGLTGHPRRQPGPEQMMLVSPCGFPEFEHFDALVHTFKKMAHMHGMTYAGEILRPYAEPLSRRSLQHLFTAYYDLLRQAGEQLIAEGRISDELQAELRKDLFPGGKEQAYELANAYWSRQMDRHHVPAEERHTVYMLRDEEPAIRQEDPRPTDTPGFRDTIAGMASAFNPDAANGLVADIQFRGINDEDSDYALHIEHGACTFHDGVVDAPTLTIHTPPSVWLAISRGDLNGAQAFMEGQYRVEGDVSLLMRLSDLFSA